VTRNGSVRLALCLAALAASGVSVAKDFVIHAGTLIDAVGERPRREVSILVHEDKIVSVQAGFRV
jgi:hypothetical protein